MTDPLCHPVDPIFRSVHASPDWKLLTFSLFAVLIGGVRGLPGGPREFFGCAEEAPRLQTPQFPFLKHPERSAGEQAHFSSKPNKGCLKRLQKTQLLLERLGYTFWSHKLKTQILFGINEFTDGPSDLILSSSDAERREAVL